MRHRRRLVLPALAALVSLSGPAAPTEASGGPQVSARAQLQAGLDALTAKGIPGAAGHLQVAGAGMTASSGVSDVSRATPLPPQARFRVGSITKTFVATVVLQLVEEDRLELDGPVATWLPGLLAQGEVITVRQLLNHTSGLFDYAADPATMPGIFAGRVASPAELVALASSHPARFAPGTSWEYSNTNYIVAGLLAEAVTGSTLEHELERRIFRPLGLGHTSFPASGDIDGAHAHGYVPPSASPTGAVVDATSFSPSWTWAAGAIVSTPADVTRFFRALLGGRLLGPASLDAMKTTVPLTAEGDVGYGLGIVSLVSPCGVVWGHDGTVFGYHAMSLHLEQGSRSATVAATMSPAEDADRAVDELAASSVCPA